MSAKSPPSEKSKDSDISASETSRAPFIPVTCGVELGSHTGPEEDEDHIQNEPAPVSQWHEVVGRNDDAKMSLEESSNEGYIEARGSSGKQISRDSPARVVAGAQTGEELLRRLSLVPNAGQKKDVNELDPKVAHPNLDISGSVISATFCVPFTVHFLPERQWELRRRHGSTALYDSLSYLSSSSSNWKHTLVGWTGEITESQSDDSPGYANLDQASSFNRALAAVSTQAEWKRQKLERESGIQVTPAERRRLDQQLEREFGGKISPVWLADEEDESSDTYILKDQRRWRRFAERELYTLFHYTQNEPSDGRAMRKSWADYSKMNKTFADRIVDAYKPGDVILIHDYQLLLVPSMLRQRLPNAYIAFFLHIPFPSGEFYRCMSRRKEVLEGILGANMIGFQSYSYSRHFSSCCTRILGFDSSPAGVDAYGAHVAVDVFPFGINAESIEKLVFNNNPKVDEKMLAFQQKYSGKKIIVGRDRLDTVRGVEQKFQAFELFLERYPNWRGKVILIQVSSAPDKGAEQEAADRKFAHRLSDLVADINGRYGTSDYSPVEHFPKYLSEEQYFALLRVADVGLCTSLRDGMNTSSLEYVICQRDNHGPLIISEFSATAAGLANAIHINPWNLGEVADAINTALTMTASDRVMEEEKLYRHIMVNDTRAWTNNFINRLLTNLSSFDQSFATPALDQTKLLKQYRAAKKRLFMLDYDGTLTPIVKDPQSAIPSDRVLRTLKTLASDPANSVWIISGRDQVFLDEWMGHISDLGLSAEHGSFMRYPKTERWENIAGEMNMSWRDDVMRIFGHFTERTQGSFIEPKNTAITWHYRRADPDYGVFQAQQCQKYLEQTVVPKYDVEVMAGKANLEVHPRFVNKGQIARRLINQYTQESGDEKLEFMLCLGDDFTDENMFRTLRQSNLDQRHIFSVTVGASSKQTLAGWHLLEPADVISVLSLLNSSKDTEDIGDTANSDS